MLKKLRTGGGASSVAYIVLGIILMLFPGTATNIVVRLVGIAALIYGVSRVIDYTKGRNDMINVVIGGLIAIGGIILLVNPAFVVSILPTILGIYIIIEGISEVRAALNMRSQGYDRWTMAFILSLLVLLVGLFILFNPFTTVTISVMIFGGALIVAGITGMVEQKV